MKTIYVIRHGQTEQNKKNVVQGSSVNSDLNPTGRRQARAFYRMYRHIHFDKIYISQLKRTKQTVIPFINNGIRWEAHHGLNEIKWGVREGKRLTENDDKEYYQVLKAWKNGEIHRKFEGGESPQEMSIRQKLIFDKIMSRPEEKNVLICMHGRAMRCFMCMFADIPISQMHLFAHSNVALYKIHFDGSQFHILERNNTAHLRPIEIQSHQNQTHLA